MVETINQIVSRASDEIKKLPESDLKRIDYKLNRLEWDEQLGKKPQDWDEIPNWKNKKILWINMYVEDKNTRTKTKIINPLRNLIYEIFKTKSYYKDEFIYLKGYTEQQFEYLWESSLRESALTNL